MPYYFTVCFLFPKWSHTCPFINGFWWVQPDLKLFFRQSLMSKTKNTGNLIVFFFACFVFKTIRILYITIHLYNNRNMKFQLGVIIWKGHNKEWRGKKWNWHKTFPNIWSLPLELGLKSSQCIMHFTWKCIIEYIIRAKGFWNI